MIEAVVPALVLAGIGFGTRRASKLGPIALVASLGLFLYVLRFIATDPYLERHDWGALAKVIPGGSTPRLYVVPSDGRTPIEYYTGRSLNKFERKRFPDGIATRRVVVISDYPAITGPGGGFHLVGQRFAPQHWTVKVYASRSPIAINPAQVATGKVMVQRSAALVAGGNALRKAEAATDLRRPVSAGGPGSRVRPPPSPGPV
jgi:hypothetical protein